MKTQESESPVKESEPNIPLPAYKHDYLIDLSEPGSGDENSWDEESDFGAIDDYYDEEGGDYDDE